MPPKLLREKNPHPRDRRIHLNEKSHTYTVDGKTKYTSVTTWVNSHFTPFNPHVVIASMMSSPNWENSKYYGMTKEEIMKTWSQTNVAGTKLHYDIECFYNEMEITNESVEWKYFENFQEKYGSALIPYRTEWKIFDDELKLSGTIDMVFQNKDGDLEMYDWKRSGKIERNSYGKFAKTECISEIPDCNIYKYGLQLNTYKYILEKNYGKKIKNMYLVFLHPDFKKFRRIPIDEFDCMDDLMEYRKTQI